MAFFYPSVDLETPCLFTPDRKPSLRLLPDRTHPLTNGLSSWLIPPYGNEDWSGFHKRNVLTRIGIAFEFNGFNEYIFTYDDSGSKEYSFFIILSSLYRLGKLRTNCVLDKDNVFRFSWNDSDNSGGVSCYTSQGTVSLRYPLLGAGEYYKLGASMGASEFKLYKGGDVSRETSGVILNDHSAPISFGNNVNRSLVWWPGQIVICYIWHRALSSAEQYSLARDPYQFLVLG